MKILIIGGTSSIAKKLKPILSEFSEVITAGRKGCDITIDLNSVEKVISFPNNIDVVVHTAAAFGGNSYDDILNTEYINVIGTLKLCEASAKVNVKHFIYISSIYGDLKDNSPNYSIYSISKKHAEEIALFYCNKSQLPVTILKPTMLYGNDDSFRKHQPLIYAFADKAQSNENIDIFGNHDAKRNYLHIDDLALIIKKIVQHKITGVFPLTNTEDITISQIATAAMKAFNSNGQINFVDEKENIADNVFGNDNTLYNLINFFPQITIEQGMNKIATYRRNTNE
jgi:nucleoside-diphosphate-sugar epimerase